MIKLSDISARTITPSNAPEIKELIEKTGAESVRDVLGLSLEYPEYDWKLVYELLDGSFDKTWELAKKRGKKPEIYTTKGYCNHALQQQDSLNKGKILLVNNPIQKGVRNCALRNKTIKTIKSDLAHTFPNGENYVTGSGKHGEYRNIGIDSIPRLIAAIEMYEEQIERQALLTPRRDINLFELHKEEKLDIVEAVYSEIILYLLYNAEEKLIWNELTDYKRKKYISSAINKKQEDVETRETIKEYVANYTTIKELEEVANHKLKVLKRFIVK